MLHVTSPSAAPSTPVFAPESHPDAELANLMPALQAAIRERDAFGDADIDTPANDPGYKLATERRQGLTAAVDAAAERILALRPRTITGLLLTAQAAAATTDWLWTDDDAEDEREPAERALRILCDNLFGLFGVDRHDNSVGGPPVPDTDPATERAILRMLVKPPADRQPPAAPVPDPELVGLVEKWLAAERALEEPGLSEGQSTPIAREACALQRAIYAFPARSLADLCAKLPAFRDEAGGGAAAGTLTPVGPDTPLDAACLRGLVADLKRLSVGPGASTSLPNDPSRRQPDPIFAAIEASRLALDAHIAACNAEDADTIEGDARRTAAGETAYRTWRSLLAAKPATAAGARALALRAIDQLERGGCWSDENNEEDARALFSAIAAAGPSPDHAPSPGTMLTVEGGPGERSQEPEPVITAAAEFDRVNAAIRMLLRSEDRDSEEVPGYLDLEQQRSAAIDRLTETPAASFAGAIAKGRALRAFDTLYGTEHAALSGIALSLADDVERLGKPAGLRNAPSAAPFAVAAE